MRTEGEKEGEYDSCESSGMTREGRFRMSPRGQLECCDNEAVIGFEWVSGVGLLQMGGK